MKKWICLLTACLLVCTALISCGDKNKNEGNDGGSTPPSQEGSLPTGQDPILDDLDWELD